MKCTKIKLSSRKEYPIKGHGRNYNTKAEHDSSWTTNGYHGYSYKLARTHKADRVNDPQIPCLSIKTIVFPENIVLGSGTSSDRWANKTPRLISAKAKNHTPRKNIFDDEYDFSYDISDIIEKQEIKSDNKNEELNLSFDQYEIEELMDRSQRDVDKPYERRKNMEMHVDEKYEDKLKKKRSKLKKTIRFSFSKPASPVTEQIIRVDVCSNISPEDLLQIEKSMVENGLPRIKYHTVYDFEGEDQYESKNENKMQDNSMFDGNEEECIIKCKQLALSHKKR